MVHSVIVSKKRRRPIALTVESDSWAIVKMCQDSCPQPTLSSFPADMKVCPTSSLRPCDFASRLLLRPRRGRQRLSLTVKLGYSCRSAILHCCVEQSAMCFAILPRPADSARPDELVW